MTQSDADAAIRVLLEEMVSALHQGRRIEIRGFGSFKVNHRAARIARNPKTGEKVEVAAKQMPRFRASKALQQRLMTRAKNQPQIKPTIPSVE